MSDASRRALRILLVGNDSGGHLSSMVAFARMLREKGHTPYVLSAASARGVVEDAGAVPVPVREPEAFGIGAVLGRAIRDGDNVLTRHVPRRLQSSRVGAFVAKRDRELLFRRMLPRVIASTASEIQHAVREVDADCVVADAISFGAPYGAKLAGVPFVGLATDPAFSLDAKGMPFLLPNLALRAVPARLWNRGVDAALPLRRLRAKLGLPPQRFTAELYASCISDELHIVIAPPDFTGAPAAPGHLFPGPLVVPSLDARAVDVEVSSSTVLVTGSTTGHPRGVAALRATVMALAETSLDVVVAAGPLKGWAPTVPSNVKLVDAFVRHDDLVPRAGVVVTHGGWGIVTRAMRAGTPLVVTPAFGPQDFVGARIDALKLGVELAVDAIDPSSMADACRRAMTDPEIRKATTRMRERLLALDTPSIVASAIERLVAERRTSRKGASS